MRGVLLTVDPVRRQSVDHQLFVPELQTFRRILVLERAFGSVVPDRLLQQAFHGHSIDVVGRNRDLLRKRFHVLPRAVARRQRLQVGRSEEHTSELQSLMRISYAVFGLKKKKKPTQRQIEHKMNYI